MARAGRDRRPGGFDWPLFLILAFLDFFAVVGLYVFTRTFSMADADLVPESVRDRVVAASDQAFELMTLPMVAVSGLSWYGVFLNPLIHGFLGERVICFFRHRCNRKP